MKETKNFLKEISTNSSLKKKFSNKLYLKNCKSKKNKQIKYNFTYIFNKFSNILMKDGKNTISKKHLIKSILWAKNNKKITKNFFMTAVNNVRPLLDLKQRKRTFRKKIMKVIPMKPSRSYTLGINWIIEATQRRTERTLTYRLYLELLNAYNRKGYAIKKKNDLHKECKSIIFKPRKKS